MLTNLKIVNYAIIDSIDIPFYDGFSVITGETGAGKSVLLGALGLILGERMDSRSVRNGGKKTIVEARFNIGEYPDLKSFFDENDLDYNDDECIIRREITPEGKSRAFINDTPATLAVVKILSQRLVDIHSQHSNTLIANPGFQLSMLDILAGNGDLRTAYSNIYAAYRAAQSELRSIEQRIAEARKETDYNQFLYDQLSSLQLVDGEEEELEETQRRLSNVQQIKESLWSVTQILDNDEQPVLSALNSATNKLANLSALVPEAEALSVRLDSLAIELRDILETVSDINEGTNDDPRELQRVEDRMAAILSLKRKHSVATVSELIDIKETLEAKLNLVENSEYEVEKLKTDIARLHSELEKAADALSCSRIDAAHKFETQLQALAKPLGLHNIKCIFNIEKCDYTASGSDIADLRIAFNKNQEPNSIGSSASGGEMSRIMLCVKYILAQRVNLPTVIFDEIDTGVSGEIANKMGEMMANMALNMQVVAITHLPQVAALGSAHYKVFKHDTEDATITAIKELDSAERITEIAGMLGADSVSEAAINNAISLLNNKRI